MVLATCEKTTSNADVTFDNQHIKRVYSREVALNVYFWGVKGDLSFDRNCQLFHCYFELCYYLYTVTFNFHMQELRSFTVTICVEPKYHPNIIGRKGATINKIRDDHGVRIPAAGQGRSQFQWYHHHGIWAQRQGSSGWYTQDCTGIGEITIHYSCFSFPPWPPPPYLLLAELLYPRLVISCNYMYITTTPSDSFLYYNILSPGPCFIIPPPPHPPPPPKSNNYAECFKRRFGNLKHLSSRLSNGMFSCPIFDVIFTC